jgi:hypothetical protein
MISIFMGFNKHQWDAIRLLACEKALSSEQIEKFLIENRSEIATSVLVTGLKPDDAMACIKKAGYPQNEDLWPYINMLAAA